MANSDLDRAPKEYTMSILILGQKTNQVFLGIEGECASAKDACSTGSLHVYWCCSDPVRHLRAGSV